MIARFYRVVALAALMLAVPSAWAEDYLLYWQIVDAEDEGQNSLEFSYATLRYVASDTAPGDNTATDLLYVYNAQGNTGSQFVMSSSGNPDSTSAVFSGPVGAVDDPAKAFLVELWNADDTLAGWYKVSYATVSSSIWSTEDITSAGSIAPAMFNSFTAAVPEPSSGLLLIIGAGLLALRRKGRARYP